MAQVSYGTITITDTNDIERIYTVYAKSANNTTVPVAAAANWKESISEAPGTGNYIWQRTVVEKSGTGDKTYSDPVCLTGEEGTDATEISGIEVRYGISADWNTQPTSWSADTPAYDSSKPKYWTRTRLVYDTNPVTYSDSVYTKDEALTKAVSDSAIAKEQATSNINEVQRIWYASSSNETPDYPSSGITTGENNIYDDWTNIKPTEEATHPYYFYCEQTCTGGGVYSWGEILLDTTNYQLNALDKKLKAFFYPGDTTTPRKDVIGGYSGAYAVAKNEEEGLDITDISTYGYNIGIRPTNVTIGYNEIPVIELEGGSGELNIYQLPIINDEGDNDNKIIPGKLGVKLNTQGLSFYNNNGVVTSIFSDSISLASNGADITIGSIEGYNTYIDTYGLQLRKNEESYATLNNNGLILSKGGIQAGDIDDINNHFIYVSTEDFPLKNYIKTEDEEIDNNKDYYELINNQYELVDSPIISDINNYYEFVPGITINNHTPTASGIDGRIKNDFGWREVIGSKFGVDSEGNLYAGNAHIEGDIVASSLTIKNNNGTSYNGLTAIESSRYSIGIKQDTTNVINDNQVYLYPTLYYNGTADTTPLDTDFVWYNIDDDINNISLGTPGSTGGRFLATYDITYKVIYKKDNNTIISQIITPVKSEKISKYISEITEINENGIKIHPAGNENNFYVQITSSKLSFFQGSTEVAYITGNQLYITKSVVLQQMDVGRPKVDIDGDGIIDGFGQWSWKVRKNANNENNLYLKWLG